MTTIKKIHELMNIYYRKRKQNNFYLKAEKLPLYFDQASGTFTYKGNHGKSVLITHERSESRIRLDISFGFFFKKTVFTFYYNVIGDINQILDPFDKGFNFYKNMISNLCENCAFLHCTKKDLMKAQELFGNHFKKFNFDKHTSIDYIRFIESYTIESVYGEIFYVSFVKNEMKMLYIGKHPYVENKIGKILNFTNTKYLVLQSVHSDEWIMIFSLRNRIGFLGNSNGKKDFFIGTDVKCRHIFKNIDNDDDLFFTRFSIDCLKYNKNMLETTKLRLIESLDITIDNMTVDDYKLFEMYTY